MSDQAVDPDAFNTFEAAGWEQQAAGYEDFFAPISKRLVDPLLDDASVGSGTRVLDVAAGPGFISARAAERGATVVGIDVAASMVALARRLHPELDFRQGDAEALPFPDESFDAVVANLLMLHLGRPEHGCAELARVLVPGGRLALTVWDAPDRARLIGVMLDALAEAGAVAPADIPVGPPFFRFSDEHEFARLLGDQGLEDVAVRTIAFTHHASAAALWDGLVEGTVRTAALIVRQTSAMQDQIRSALERNMQRYDTGEGPEVPVSVKLASGRKPG